MTIGDASSTAFMNLTTSSYVDVDWKFVDSAVVFRSPSAVPRCCAAKVPQPNTTHAMMKGDLDRRVIRRPFWHRSRGGVVASGGCGRHGGRQAARSDEGGERNHEIRALPAALDLVLQRVARHLRRRRCAVWTIGRQRVEHVDDADDLREQRDVVARGGGAGG